MSDSWDFYFARVNDELASLLIDLGIRSSAPDAGRPWLLWVWVTLNEPRDDGLPTPEEAEALARIEDCLNEAVEESVAGSMVGRISTAGRREFYYYAPEFGGFDAAVTQALEEFEDHPYESGSSHDPNWDHYIDLLYPGPRDWQRIKNRRVVDALKGHGDPLTVSRPVFHWAYFDSVASRQNFVDEILNHDFEVRQQGDEEDSGKPLPFGVQFARVDFVDWDSVNTVTLQLMEWAEQFDGDYDGWETSVEKAD